MKMLYHNRSNYYSSILKREGKLETCILCGTQLTNTNFACKGCWLKIPDGKQNEIENKVHRATRGDSIEVEI